MARKETTRPPAWDTETQTCDVLHPAGTHDDRRPFDQIAGLSTPSQALLPDQRPIYTITGPLTCSQVGLVFAATPSKALSGRLPVITVDRAGCTAIGTLLSYREKDSTKWAF